MFLDVLESRVALYRAMKYRAAGFVRSPRVIAHRAAHALGDENILPLKAHSPCSLFFAREYITLVDLKKKKIK